MEVVFRNIRSVAWKSFDQRFEEILRRIEWRDSLLRQEIQLMHMQKTHGEINAAEEERNGAIKERALADEERRCARLERITTEKERDFNKERRAINKSEKERQLEAIHS